MSDLDTIRSLIQEIKIDYPKLYQALKILTENVDTLIDDNRAIRRDLEETASPVLSPTDFTYELKVRTIGLSWTPVTGAVQYEIREGIDWDTASLITRVINFNVELEPRASGSYNFLLKSINGAGNYSDTPASLEVVVTAIPTVNISARVIDNNVLLDWDEPNHPFEIVEYRIYKTGVQIGYVDSSFFIYFESVGGSFTYGVDAVDLAGNVSPLAEITVDVNQPPDYVLESTFVSDLIGVYDNVFPLLS